MFPRYFRLTFDPDLTYLLKQGGEPGTPRQIINILVEEPFLLRDVQQDGSRSCTGGYRQYGQPVVENNQELPKN